MFCVKLLRQHVFRLALQPVEPKNTFLGENGEGRQNVETFEICSCVLLDADLCIVVPRRLNIVRYVKSGSIRSSNIQEDHLALNGSGAEWRVRVKTGPTEPFNATTIIPFNAGVNILGLQNRSRPFRRIVPDILRFLRF